MRYSVVPLRASRAFTLVELLASLAIITVLTAIVAVGVGTARQAAKQADNVGKLRNLGVACSVYAAEHRGRMPVTVVHAAGETNTSGYRLWSNRKDLLRILSDVYPGGEGSGYVSGADVFYGPFAESVNETRSPGQLMPYLSSGVGFTIGYMFYSVPESSGVVIEPGLFNDYNNRGHLPSTPLLSDPLDATSKGVIGFSGKKYSVVRLDGSVATFDPERFTGVASSFERIRILAGIK